MQTRNRIFDDLAKVANGAAGTMAGLKSVKDQGRISPPWP